MELRKIESAEAREKREKKKKIWIGIIICAIMIASTASFALLSKEENSSTNSSQQKYGNFSFNRQGELWQTTAGGKDISTLYLPQQTENITCNNCNLASLQSVENKEIYFSVDSSFPFAGINEIERNIQDSAIRLQLSCLKESENSSFCVEHDFPIKTCPQETQNFNNIFVFEMRESKNNETKVLYSNGCVKIEAENSTELARAADSLIFAMFKIKK